MCCAPPADIPFSQFLLCPPLAAQLHMTPQTMALAPAGGVRHQLPPGDRAIFHRNEQVGGPPFLRKVLWAAPRDRGTGYRGHVRTVRFRFARPGVRRNDAVGHSSWGAVRAVHDWPESFVPDAASPEQQDLPRRVEPRSRRTGQHQDTWAHATGAAAGFRPGVTAGQLRLSADPPYAFSCGGRLEHDPLVGQ